MWEKDFFLGGQSTYWSLEGEDRREKIARSRAIATKAVQAYTSLLSEFLPIFDFFPWVRFLNIELFCWFLCRRKGPQFALLRLVTCLFALFWFWMSLMSSEANISVPIPTNQSLLKNHEMWFYFLLISHVCFPIVSAILYHTRFCFSSYPSYGHQFFIWGWLQSLGMQSWDSAKRTNISKF